MFDKHIFMQVLKKARGNRTNEDYYKDSGVSRAYISNYINGTRNKAPSPEIIKKLADSAHNGISYQELMVAAGYIDNFTIENMTIGDVSVEKHTTSSYTNKQIADTLKKSFNKTNEIADEIIQFLIKKGVLEEGEELTDEKRKWLLNLLDKAIDMSRL